VHGLLRLTRSNKPYIIVVHKYNSIKREVGLDLRYWAIYKGEGI
jgi:hypothetical protein